MTATKPLTLMHFFVSHQLPFESWRSRDKKQFATEFSDRLDHWCPGSRKNCDMKKSKNFFIPKNTSIRRRNVRQELKLKPFVTDRDLHFIRVECTGDGGSTYYFELDHWLIVVASDSVIQASASPRADVDSRQPNVDGESSVRTPDLGKFSGSPANLSTLRPSRV